MKAMFLYHTVKCCRFDCMVRSCTCKMPPVVTDYDGNLESFLRDAAFHSGDTLTDGRIVESLVFWKETTEGVLAEFTTRDPRPLETECENCGRPGEVEDGVLVWATSGCAGPASALDREDVEPGHRLPELCPDCRDDETEPDADDEEDDT